MKLAALMVLMPALAMAQFLPPGGGAAGGGGMPDPSRNDVAASYSATGPNGVKTAPQATPGALGACAALAGAHAAATPVGESAPSPYFCDGIAWRRVYTDADGTLPNADVVVPGYTFAAQAPSGAYAIKVANTGARADFGGGSADELYSDGSQLISPGSIMVAANQSLTVDIIGSSNANRIRMFPGAWVTYQGLGSLPACTGDYAGGLISLTADGRPYWCDGTAAYRVARVIPISATLSIPTMTGGGEATITTSVAGANVGDHVTLNMGCDLTDIGIRRAGVWSAGVVSIVVANGDQATPQPASPTNCLFLGEVQK